MITVSLPRASAGDAHQHKAPQSLIRAFPVQTRARIQASTEASNHLKQVELSDSSQYLP